jgi:hypothetical protein
MGYFYIMKAFWDHALASVNWMDWMRKDGPNGKKWPTTKRFGFTPSSFGNVTSYTKDDIQQKQIEEDLALFIAKKSVSLSYVQAPFFRRLFFK